MSLAGTFTLPLPEDEHLKEWIQQELFTQDDQRQNPKEWIQREPFTQDEDSKWIWFGDRYSTNTGVWCSLHQKKLIGAKDTKKYN